MCKRISSAFQPVRSSSPQYIGEYLHPRTLSCYDDDDYTPSPPTPLHQHRWNSASPKVFLPNSSTVSLPASAVLGLRGRSATPTAAPTVAKTTDDACHKRSHSVGASQNLTLNLAPRKSDSDFGRPNNNGPNHQHSSLEALTACEEHLEERRRQVSCTLLETFRLIMLMTALFGVLGPFLRKTGSGRTSQRARTGT